MSVKTLHDRRQAWSAPARAQTILDVAAEAGITHPDALPPGRRLRRRRLPAVPGGSRGIAEAAARLHHQGRARAWTSSTNTRAAAQLPADDRRAALRRAQPRLRGLRGQRPLRAADPGLRQWAWTTCATSTASRSWEVDATHARFGMDHNRCILCTRCVRVCGTSKARAPRTSRAAAPRPGHHRPQPAVGRVRHLHQLRQVRQVCPTGALFDKGATVGEMERDRDNLEFIVTAREKKQWIRVEARSATKLASRRSCDRHRLARRLFRLPHVVPGPGRVPHRAGRQSRPRLQPGHGREGVSRGRGRRAWSKAPSQRGQPGACSQADPRADQGPRLLRRLRRDGQRARHPQPARLATPRASCKRAYVENADTSIRGVPEEPGIVPALLDRVRPVHEVVHGGLLPARLPAAGRPHQGFVLARAARRRSPEARRTASSSDEGSMS